MNTFTLKYPRAHQDPTEFSSMLEKQLECVPGKNLHVYFKELHLNAMRLRCRLLLEKTRASIRLTHIPLPGEVILLKPAGRALS